MKKLIFILLVLLLQSACKKDPIICNDFTQLTDRANLADPKATGSQALLDTLAKHPEYQVTRVSIDQYNWVVVCNVFYKNLLVFSDGIEYFENTNHNVATFDTINFSTINFSLTPTINYTEAIKLARAQEDFSKTCISYRLDIFDLNAGQSFVYVKNYKLVWLVQGNSGYPYVYLDANTGQTYRKFDGIDI